MVGEKIGDLCGAGPCTDDTDDFSLSCKHLEASEKYKHERTSTALWLGTVDRGQDLSSLVRRLGYWQRYQSITSRQMVRR